MLDDHDGYWIIGDMSGGMSHITVERPDQERPVETFCGIDIDPRQVDRTPRRLCPYCVIRAAQWLTAPPEAER